MRIVTFQCVQYKYIIYIYIFVEDVISAYKKIIYYDKLNDRLFGVSV